MPRYVVPVTYTQVKEIRVFARDEQAATEKAVEIVEAWEGVTSAEADDAEVEE
jgi:hypothetical protein